MAGLNLGLASAGKGVAGDVSGDDRPSALRAAALFKMSLLQQQEYGAPALWFVAPTGRGFGRGQAVRGRHRGDDESYFGPRLVRGKRGHGAGRKVPVIGCSKGRRSSKPRVWLCYDTYDFRKQWCLAWRLKMMVACRLKTGLGRR
jgi:hypothetical protein